ncbi:MAG: M4 family metallopeptidase, partial [Planctomycetota bacterium]
MTRKRGRFAFAVALVCWATSGYAQPPSGELRVRTSPRTGLASFVTSADGGPIAVSAAPGRSEVRPTDFLAQYGHWFGVTQPETELVVVQTETDAFNTTHTTYEQVYQNVRVFSGVLKVHQNATGQITAANGDFYRLSPKLNMTPTLTAVDAEGIAAAALAGNEGTVAPQALREGPRGPLTEAVKGGLKSAAPGGSELVMVDPGWYGDPPLGPHLAYYVILADAATGRCEAFFVDAHDGSVLDRWNLVYDARDRSVHDAGETAELPGALARAEGDPPVTDAEVNAAYDYLGDAYDYLFRAFGRDSIDDQSMTIVATVHSTAVRCPNAFWSFIGMQAGFCTGTATDDIVAHEMTHGVTQATANLIYQNQSGQLNESFSDVFGELVDLFNGDAAFPGPPGGPPDWPTHPTGPGTDAPNNLRTACSAKPLYTDGVRWLFGEDGGAATPFDGALRDLWEPTCLSQPDRANSPLQTCSLADNGGVHSGSGIPNHAFAMLTDGKTFNGYTVNGIGPIKAEAVWYRALTTYLTVASDFQDAYDAFNQAAADLIGIFPNDPRTGLPSASLFTAADAFEVDKALLAVEMNTPGACGASVPVLDSAAPLLCTARATLFADDFESGTNGWAVSNSGPPTPYDWVQTSGPLPFQRPGAAWFCSDPDIGDCSTSGVNEAAVHSLFSPVIATPAEVNLPALVFTHFVETEPRWDGGDVRISINGGPWQKLPRAAFRHNPYNTTLFTAGQGSTNPLAGELSFSGVGGRWGTSLIDLAPFVTGGDTLQVRFDFAKDWCFGYTGWFIDNFEVYHCPASGDCNSNGIADDVDVAPGAHQVRFLQQPPNHSSGNPSDLDNGGLGVTAIADNFLLLRRETIQSVGLWGGYHGGSPAPPDDFTVIFHEEAGGLPGPAVATRPDVPSTRVPTGGTFLPSKIAEWQFFLTFEAPVVLEPGSYFVEVLNDTTGSPDTFIWERATVGDLQGAAFAYEAPGVSWGFDVLINFTLELYGPVVGADCNSNALPDECETLPDCNTNGILDACDPCGDHDGDGDADLVDLAVLVDCLTGPGGSAAPPCRCLLDADGDEDLDLADFA